MQQDVFADLIGRLRSGDPAAAAELVRLYEPEIRLELRTWLRLRDPRLRRVIDSADICQSVLASFFVRTAAGQFDLNQPQQLQRLLIEMARNKLAEYVRHQQRQRRDIRRVQSVSPEELALAGTGESPSQQVAMQELLKEFRGRLSEEERQIADRRASGMDWTKIVEEMGGTAEARRKQLARAIDRVARELGLVEAAVSE